MLFLRQIYRFFDVLQNVMKNIALILLIILTTLVLIDVIMLYFFNSSLNWILEVAEYILVYILFLSAARYLNGGGQVQIDFIVKRLNPKTQFFLDLFGSAVGLFVSITIAVFGFIKIYSLHLNNVRMESVLSLPQSYLYAIVPIGFLFLSIEFILAILKKVQKKSL